jgi:4-amino-4-deoxy-L-arabinose transferase-like glycosyltransferase
VLQVAAGPLARIHQFWPETDNHFFDAWGRKVAAGDLLQREPWHPTPAWMQLVAASAQKLDPGLLDRLGIDRAAPDQARAEALWDHWLGGATWFQEPGYPYLVGLTYRLTGGTAWAVFLWQLAAGTLGVLAVWRLGVRVHSQLAGAAAGALAILAPVPLYLEVALLRDAAVAWLGPALALLMAWTVEGGRRRWLLLGLAVGGAALLKQTFLAFPVLMGAWRLAAVRSPWRDRLAAAGLVAAGVALALSPAVARNLAVGVPALAMNGSAAAMLPLNHTASAVPQGVRFDVDYVRALVASDGNLSRALAAALATHPGPGSVLALEGGKLLYAFHGFDVPNNVDLALFRQGSPLVASLPATPVLVMALGLLGLAGLRPGRGWPVLVAVAGSLPALLLATVVGRYRAALVAAMLPLAGVAVAQVVGWLRGRRWVPLTAGALATAAYLAWATGEPPGRGPARRAGEYRGAGEHFAAIDPAYAALNFAEAVRLAPGDPGLRRRLDEVRRAAGEGGGGRGEGR